MGEVQRAWVEHSIHLSLYTRILSGQVTIRVNPVLTKKSRKGGSRFVHSSRLEDMKMPPCERGAPPPICKPGTSPTPKACRFEPIETAQALAAPATAGRSRMRTVTGCRSEQPRRE